MAIRRSYSGSAVATALTADITPTSTVIQVGATTNFPNTTIGPFVVTVERGTPNQEKMLISSFTSTTLIVASGGRGYDGTAAIEHRSGAAVACTLDSQTINEANAFVMANGTVAPSTSAVGDAAANGTSTAPAAADHKHAREGWVAGATTASNPGDAESDGTSTSPARADHKHPREPVQCPVGASVRWWSTSSYPTNFLPLTGGTVPAATWPALATAWPDRVSGGNITLPDTRDKFIIGAGGSYAVGASGGAASVTLGTANIPQFSDVGVTVVDPGHPHGITDPGHVNGSPGGVQFVVGLTGAGPYNVNQQGTSSPGGDDWVSFSNETGSATTGITVNAAKTGITASVTFGSATPTAVSILPPFIAGAEIVRAA